MLWGVLLTVRLMVMRPPPRPPIFRMSSFDCFKAVWPANADCWIAEVAMTMLSCSKWGGVVRPNEMPWTTRALGCYNGNVKMLWIRISTHQQHSIGSQLDLDFQTDCSSEREVIS